MKGFDSFGDDDGRPTIVTRPGKPVIPVSNVRASVVTIGGVQRPALGLDDTVVSAETEEREDESKEKTMESNEMNEVGSDIPADLASTFKPAVKSVKKRPNRPRKGGKDMHSGMELLELAFLLGVVEDVDSREESEVIMRRLCFGELVRSDQRHEISSNTLKIYAMDVDGLYGKQVQCQAMLELTERTSK
ncbi:MAG: hypothetical protein FVQ79_11140 [Planctomycetes bacterium]|nr:hypothetical protein [Planctomycetota bacterium]